jgi:hypothetical protein
MEKRDDRKFEVEQGLLVIDIYLSNHTFFCFVLFCFVFLFLFFLTFVC